MLEARRPAPRSSATHALSSWGLVGVRGPLLTSVEDVPFRYGVCPCCAAAVVVLLHRAAHVSGACLTGLIG